MKSNLHLHEHPRSKRSKTPLKNHNFARKTRAATLKHSTSAQTVKLLGRLNQLSQTSVHLESTPISTPADCRLEQIPRYVFVGDQPGESEIRLGVFAGLREDDDAGPKAIADFINDLVVLPLLGSAFRMYAYPILNPASLEIELPFKQAHRNETGRRWKSPAAYLIEREHFVVQFQGLIVIHTTDQIEGLQAAVYGFSLRAWLRSGCPSGTHRHPPPR
jgi:hypothetical protein